MELYVINMQIASYEEGSYNNVPTRRDRKLLLKKQELKKLHGKSLDVGLTIVPTRLFISDKGFAKLDIALAKGKKLHDKRHDIKEKDVKREMAREKYG
jgi:SsrA-binding protein